ncbi:MAG: ABC transporter permease, partial [Proteobacteria bacterium]|nr:ABC transporter permease [Pseudomonadota bacterium]NDF54496.1 ABC transporter permease [Pseudomonadota bacterium]
MRMRWTRHRDWRDASYPVRFLSKVRLAFVAECASMLQFVFRRTLWIIPVLITISLITFVMMKSTPGGPFDVTSSGRDMPKETQELLMRRYHLDEPDWKQYLIYIGVWPTGNDAAGAPIFKGVLQGDLGPSYQYKGRGVTDIIFAPPSVGGSLWESRFGRTATLGIFGFVFGVALGLPLGILAAVRHNTWLDYVSLFVSTLFVSTPGFVLAIFLMIIFGLWLKWLPIAARTWNTWQPWLLPSFCLGVGLSAFIARLTRATMLEVLRQDYIRTAR